MDVKNHASKLEKALAGASFDGAVITSPENIRYFSGFASPDALVFVGGGRIAIVTDSRYWDQVESECPQAELVKYPGTGSLAASLAEWMQKNKMGGRLAAEGSVRADTFLQMQETFKAYGVMSGIKLESSLIDELRLIKNAEELEAIAKAALAADMAWKCALPAFKEGISEADFCAELEYQMQKNGARKPSFDTIVASGPNGAYPHALVTDRIIKRGELVTVDFGCIVDGWCSDITRTIWIGDLDEGQLKIWQAVRKAHDTALDASRPGMTGRELDKIARDIVAEAGFDGLFKHSLGHGVGLAIHEGPGLRMTSETVLREGMTFTIEPGIYAPGTGGCRIEDLLYFTADGHRRLSLSPYQVPGQQHPLEAFA